ncbi:MAG TPA: tetratricopeptide repeat protein, partial [Magnetococcales bacterium]|nr:tetratricopeptide repeat protein [Magnetococcales bacterium]
MADTASTESLAIQLPEVEHRESLARLLNDFRLHRQAMMDEDVVDGPGLVPGAASSDPPLPFPWKLSTAKEDPWEGVHRAGENWDEVDPIETQLADARTQNDDLDVDVEEGNHYELEPVAGDEVFAELVEGEGVVEERVEEDRVDPEETQLADARTQDDDLEVDVEEGNHCELVPVAGDEVSAGLLEGDRVAETLLVGEDGVEVEGDPGTEGEWVGGETVSGESLEGGYIVEEPERTVLTGKERLPEQFECRGCVGQEDVLEPARGVATSRPSVRVPVLEEWRFMLHSVFKLLGRLSEVVVHRYMGLVSLGGPVRTHYYTERGHRFFQQGMIYDAIFCYRKVLDKDEKNVAVLAGMGRCYLKQEAFDRALGFLEKARELEGSGGAWLDDDLIVAYIGSGRYVWAEGLIRKGLERGSDRPGQRAALWFRLGEVLGCIDRLDEAVS